LSAIGLSRFFAASNIAAAAAFGVLKVSSPPLCANARDASEALASSAATITNRIVMPQFLSVTLLTVWTL